jgi:RimJ/RimL family protein N-acetyltransferase
MLPFPFENDLILENERVLLRPLKTEDYDLLLPFSKNEPDLWEYSLIPARNPNELKIYLSRALQEKKAKRAYPFLIIDKLSDEAAGTTRYYHINENDSCISIGYTWIGGKFQGTGLNKSMKALMLDFIFNKLKVERLEFRADALNTRSIAAIKTLGAQFEGTLRSNCTKPDGKRRDTAVLSILRSEYTQNKD